MTQVPRRHLRMALQNILYESRHSYVWKLKDLGLTADDAGRRVNAILRDTISIIAQRHDAGTSDIAALRREAVRLSQQLLHIYVDKLQIVQALTELDGKEEEEEGDKTPQPLLHQMVTFAESPAQQ